MVQTLGRWKFNVTNGSYDDIQVYFINHRYDGVQLWQLNSITGIHELIWVSNFISFFFLYPSTFNLLEVAAVDKPKMHLWETGIMRITRHPQVYAQLSLKCNLPYRRYRMKWFPNVPCPETPMPTFSFKALSEPNFNCGLKPLHFIPRIMF